MSARVFQELREYYRNVVPAPTHQQKVTRLYRAGLRTIDNWLFNRHLIQEEQAKLRACFDLNKNLDPNSATAARAIKDMEDWLVRYTHPDPYVRNYMPGGSKFMRNPPPPLDIVYPEGVPADKNFAPQNVFGIQVPMSAQPEGMKSILIDAYRKTAE